MTALAPVLEGFFLNRLTAFGPARTPSPATGTPTGCCWHSLSAAPASNLPCSTLPTSTPS